MNPGLVVGFLCVSTIAGSRAQDLNPSLQIETENGQMTFHIGERIPLRLSFFYADGVPVPVGCAPCGIRYCGVFSKPETFEVEPATGWSDPLASYFAQYFVITGGGGLPPPPTTPLQVRLDLNEWVRFDEAGDYTVKVMSHRVEGSSAGRIAVVSGAIELHIVPASPEWQDAKPNGFAQSGTLTTPTGGRRRRISGTLPRPQPLKKWFRGFGKNAAPAVQSINAPFAWESSGYWTQCARLQWLP